MSLPEHKSLWFFSEVEHFRCQLSASLVASCRFQSVEALPVILLRWVLIFKPDMWASAANVTYDRTNCPPANYFALGGLKASDTWLLLLRACDSTYHMFNAHQLAFMQGRQCLTDFVHTWTASDYRCDAHIRRYSERQRKNKFLRPKWKQKTISTDHPKIADLEHCDVVRQ